MKKLLCVVIALTMVLPLIPFSGLSSARETNAIFVHGYDTEENRLYVYTGLGTYDIWGIILPVGTRRPADGTLPSGAVKMELCETPFYDREWQRYYSGVFDLTGKNGSYVMYATDDGGGTWDTCYGSYVCCVYIDNGTITWMNFGSWGSGENMKNPDWNELIQIVNAELKDGVISVSAFAGWLIYNLPLTMRLAEEFSGEIIDTKAVNYGDTETNFNYGNSFYADFDLPEEDGFYKVYFTIQGLDFQGSKAFWVEDGKVTEIELNGINSPPLNGYLWPGIDTRYIIEPLNFYNPEDRNYIYPPRIELLYCNSAGWYIWDGIDEITAFSLDGGKNWKERSGSKVIFNEIEKHLKKNPSFQLAVKTVRQERYGVIPEGEDILFFPVIKAAPVMPKLTVNYQALYMGTNTSIPSLDRLSQQTFWALTEPNKDDIVRENIQISPLQYSNQPPYNWHEMPVTGVAVKPLYVTTTAKNGKVSYRAKKQSAFYAVRIGAAKNDDGSYTLPSKWVKISAGGLEVPKAVKPDYKKERVKPPRNTAYDMRNERGTGDGRNFVDIDGADSETWTYRTLPQRKKAAGASVSHRIASRAEFDEGATELEYGKLKTDRKLEFSYDGGEKWGGFKAPKASQTSIVLARVKQSGKIKSTIAYSNAQAQSASMYDSPAAGGTQEMAQSGQWLPEQNVLLASKNYSFTYQWGDVTNKQGKTVKGIVSYQFEPSD